MSANITRRKIIRVTRHWCGTPYRHQASCRGAGADCLGLIRGVYAELYGAPLAAPPAYERYGARGEAETIWQAAKVYLQPVAHAPCAGDVLLFRMRPHFAARHLAILVNMRGDDAAMVHAASGQSVCEVSYSPWWRARLVAAFSFPNILD